ncbi:hypothetical protein Tco_0378267 [Tanacetum coccineum]
MSNLLIFWISIDLNINAFGEKNVLIINKPIRKFVLHSSTSIISPIATTIAPGVFKLDIEPISHRLKNNSDAHDDYLKKTKEYTNTIRGLVKHARKQNPSEPLLDSACRFTKHVQELLVYVSKTCSNLPKPSEKLVDVTPLNKDKRVSGSKPSGNTKNNRISQLSCSNKTNKVEDQSRSVKSKKNKKNHVDKTECNAHVMQSMLNVNSKSMCAICNKCLFDANHYKCILDYVHDVNVLFKSKSKRNKIRKVWKPTGKVFTEIGYSWKPTRRIFTIVGNRCPLSRITSTKEVHVKDTTITPVITPSPELKGSTISDVPSSSLIDCRFENDHIAKIMGKGDYQMGNVTISRVYYVEGLEGVDLLKGSRCSNLYTLSLENLMLSSSQFPSGIGKYD